MNLRALTFAMIALSSACVELTVDEPESAAQQAIGGGGCQEWMCGTNSPVIANFGFSDIAVPVVPGELGAPNNAHMQLAGFYKASGSTTGFYMPRVIKGKLVAYPTTSTAPFNVKLSGSTLVNGYFLILTPAGWFKLWVKGVSEVKSWAQPTTRGPVVYLETYLLDWSNFQGELLTNVCSNPGGRDDTGMNGPLSFHTLLFEGDRIKASTKEVYDVDTKWFNLGCAGSALAKMALTGHTEAAKLSQTFITTLPERQTMLKMLTGDYCGDGTPFTVAGQPLNWADDRGTMKMTAVNASPPRPVVRETRWTPDGAACLDKPRVDVYWTQLGEDSFGPNVYSQVAQHCPTKMPPACSGSPLGLDGYHLITATEPHAAPP